MPDIMFAGKICVIVYDQYEMMVTKIAQMKANDFIAHHKIDGFFCNNNRTSDQFCGIRSGY